MNDEIKEILTKLKIVSKTEEGGAYICDRGHCKLLLDYITNLQNENMKYDQCLTELTDNYKNLQKELTNLQEEIDKLNKECDTYMKIATKRGNIINELEKWLEEQYEFIDTISEFPTIKEIQQEHLIMLNDYENVLNKLKELKGE